MAKIHRWSGFFGLVVLLTLLLAPHAQAALLDVGPTVPEVLGSSPPQHGFPLWYRDTSRVPLEICLSRATSPTVAGALMCSLLPGPGFDLALPTSFPGNFPDELFWWTGDARVRGARVVNGNQSINFETQLIMAIEGAFPSGAALPGDQVSFARIRILMDTVIPGTYRVIHPYGEKTFLITQADVDDNGGGGRIIFFTEDIGLAAGGNFSGALQGQIGPFLRWDSGVPIVVGGEQFIGDPSVDHTVTGSPFDTNILRVEGPEGSGIGGLGIDFIETNLFRVSGKIHQAVIPTPLNGDRVTYARDAGGMQVNVFATTQPFSNATNPAALFPANFALLNTQSALLLSSPILADTALVTNSPVDGKFFTVTDRFADPGTIPATVRVSNTTDVPLSFIDPTLTDRVTIGGATYSKVNNALTIAATSSDSVAPPVLQAFMPGMTAPLGTLASGQLVVTFPFTDNMVTPAKTYSIPPESITVRSAAGGAASATVTTFATPPASGVGLTAFPSSPQTAGLANVVFTAVGAGGTGTYEYQFWTHNGITWSLARDYLSADSWTWSTAALAPGIYTIQVNARNAGSTAPFEAFSVLVYELTAAPVPPAPATGATLSAFPAGSQPSGNSVIFSAAGIGGSGTYEFEYWLHDGVSWTRKQVYSPASSWVWDTTGAAAGDYAIQVNVRSAGSTAAFEGFTATGYSLTPAVTAPAPATGATIAATPASPKPAETRFVVFSATGSGGSGSFEFEFWLHDGISWSRLQAYSPAANAAWDTTALPAGTYTVQVNVRSAGSTAPFEAFNALVYELP